MAFFDFDALDDILEAKSRERQEANGSALGSGAPPEEASSESQGSSARGVDDDVLSEVWPDDLPGDLAALAALADGGQAAAEQPHDGSDSAFIEAWEVIFKRVVARAAPQVDAPVVAIFSQMELVFEEAGSPDPKWVKMFGRHAFILKDGRVRDPTLGDLLHKFAFPASVAVPYSARPAVLRAMRTAWVQAQAGTDFLKAPAIRGLRKAGQDALEAAARGGRFDAAVFEESFAAEVERVQEDVSGPSKRPPGGKQWEHRGPAKLRPRNGAVEVSPSDARDLIEGMRHRVLPDEEDVAVIVMQATARLSQESTLVKLEVSSKQTLHVVGDLHGQFWDLLHILEMCGEPSPTNMYLFNGDLVDRGSSSVEVLVAVLAMKLAHYKWVHVNRGNHESLRMNAVFGFMGEVRSKYSDRIFFLFGEVFRAMPLATVVNNSIFVAHGGLSCQSEDLSDVAELRRDIEPEMATDRLFVDLLWSDPQDEMGFAISRRGSGVLFGPDVTARFLEANGLSCVIRSHEMKQGGFEWSHGQKCLTVFSASNYCDVCGNDGAVCDITQLPENAPAPAPVLRSAKQEVVARSMIRKLSVADMRLRTFPPTSHGIQRASLPASLGVLSGGF